MPKIESKKITPVRMAVIKTTENKVLARMWGNWNPCGNVK